MRALPNSRSTDGRPRTEKTRSPPLMNALRKHGFFVTSALPLILICAAAGALSAAPTDGAFLGRGPTMRLPTVVTVARSQDAIGPYAQPRWSARGRFSSDTDVY